MKICLYLEGYHFLDGLLYKKIGTGLVSSYINQKAILKELNIEYVEQWDSGCNILQINTPWIWSLWYMYKAKRNKTKVIIWSHVTVEDFRKVFRFNAMLAPLMKKYLTYAYGLADLVFSPSEYTRQLLIAYGLDPKKIVAQSNGVDLKKFYQDADRRDSYRTKYDLSEIVVGTVGLAIPRKGIDTFLKLGWKFNKNKFMWFGKIYSSLLAESLPKNLPKNVEFTGYVDDILAAFNALDVFIFPSYEENQGMVILEAAATEVPILVRDIPVYNGWLVHGINCLKANNDDEFEKYLGQLINDTELRQRLTAGGVKLAQDNSLGKMAEITKTIYENLLSKTPS